MEWKFKLLKLSTYNSLNEQLKLKDQIIVAKDLETKTRNQIYAKQLSEIYDSKIKTVSDFQKRIFDLNENRSSLQIEIKELERMVDLLQNKNITQSNTIYELHTECARINTILDKYKGKRDAKGKFIKKK